MNRPTENSSNPASQTADISVRTRPDLPLGDRPRYRLTGAGVVRAEWSKFWSLRSSPITLGITLVLILAFGVLTSALFNPSTADASASAEVPTGPVSLALSGMSLAQLAIGVLGVLVSAGEYSTGIIRSTLTAVPRRLPVLWAKPPASPGSPSR